MNPLYEFIGCLVHYIIKTIINKFKEYWIIGYSHLARKPQFNASIRHFCPSDKTLVSGACLGRIPASAFINETSIREFLKSKIHELRKKYKKWWVNKFRMTRFLVAFWWFGAGCHTEIPISGSAQAVVISLRPQRAGWFLITVRIAASQTSTRRKFNFYLLGDRFYLA